MQKSYADYTVIQSQSQYIPIRKYLKTVGTKYIIMESRQIDDVYTCIKLSQIIMQ